ncbi:Anthranilate synthase, aminase component [hydrothermal vent metagenome]|uniref:anthranilate synthase n=1 Tax=hydrothermal vent metagenome TaxID=652676 RepID=A0A1W1EJI4_9ZZZZ
MKSLLFDQLTPVALYSKVRNIFSDEVTMLFESVGNSTDANFSFITIGAIERLQYINNESIYTNNKIEKIDKNPFEFLQDYYSKIDKEIYKEKVQEYGFSFVDGFIGFIGYDMVKVFEPTLANSMNSLQDTLNTPDLDLIRPKIIIAYSHKNSQLTIIENDTSLSNKLDTLKVSINEPYTPMPLNGVSLDGEGSFSIDEERFKNLVDESKESIRSGDIFQILLSNRYTQKGSINPLTFYRVLRSKNPSPYLFLLNYEEFSICGSSPEVMVRLSDNEILLRPIAGTRKRGKNEARDKELELEMINDPKECAEHLMLIDLGRNDVGRVAKTGTVKVTDMMRVERYSHVMHMVSDVIATIDDDKDMFDLFMATFTAGTMTGAPKIKAMELISHYEGLKRGFYSGSVGYFSFTGDMDSAITIRTALINDKEIILQAGAGVVADSIPELEYLEVGNKLKALIETLKDLNNSEIL